MNRVSLMALFLLLSCRMAPAQSLLASAPASGQTFTGDIASTTRFGDIVSTTRFGDIAPMPRFGDLYVCGMVTLERGAGTVLLPGGRETRNAFAQPVLVPIGSRVITTATETAHLSLGSASRLTLGPNSVLVIRSARLDLESGQCLARHGLGQFPLQVTGRRHLAIEPNGVIELSRGPNEDVLLVHAGTVTIRQGPILHIGQHMRLGRDSLTDLRMPAAKPATGKGYTLLGSRPESLRADNINSDIIIDPDSLFREVHDPDLFPADAATVTPPRPSDRGPRRLLREHKWQPARQPASGSVPASTTDREQKGVP